MSSSKNSPSRENQGGTSLPEPDADLKQLQLDRELLIGFEQYLQRIGRKLNQHGPRWLFDSYGRIIGCEEQWEFNIDQFREFIEFIDGHEHEYSNGWCRWCGIRE